LSPGCGIKVLGEKTAPEASLIANPENSDALSVGTVKAKLQTVWPSAFSEQPEDNEPLKV
jgi:hypothetical protein